jgi:hypothetical protein
MDNSKCHHCNGRAIYGFHGTTQKFACPKHITPDLVDLTLYRFGWTCCACERQSKLLIHDRYFCAYHKPESFNGIQICLDPTCHRDSSFGNHCEYHGYKKCSWEEEDMMYPCPVASITSMMDECTIKG